MRARQLFLMRAEGYSDQEVWCDESASSSQTVSLVAEPKPLTAAADADGGVAGSAPVIVMQDGGTVGAAAKAAVGPATGTAIGTPKPETVPVAVVPDKSAAGTASTVRTGKPTGTTGTGSTGKPVGTKQLPRIDSAGELFKDDDIAILKDD